MAWNRNRSALTTGDVARFLGVNFRTVLRWIHAKQLKAYQLPGRGDNRIKVNDFLHFLTENNMPIPCEVQDRTRRVLIIDDDSEMAEAIERALKTNLDPMVAANTFQAGLLADRFSPAVVIIEPKTAGVHVIDTVEMLANQPKHERARVVVISALPQEALNAALAAGAAAVIAKPFAMKKLGEAVAKLVKPRHRSPRANSKKQKP